MKITLERMRQIITEEVIKEEVSPEDATRTIVALLQGTESKVTAEIMVAVYDDMYDPDAGELEPEPEEDLPTEYQAGGAYGDRPVIEPFSKRTTSDIKEIIQEELRAVLMEYIAGNEEAQATLNNLPEPLKRKLNVLRKLMGLDDAAYDKLLANRPRLLQVLQALQDEIKYTGHAATKEIAESTVLDIEIIND